MLFQLHAALQPRSQKHHSRQEKHRYADEARPTTMRAFVRQGPAPVAEEIPLGSHLPKLELPPTAAASSPESQG